MVNKICVTGLSWNTCNNAVKIIFQKVISQIIRLVRNRIKIRQLLYKSDNEDNLTRQKSNPFQMRFFFFYSLNQIKDDLLQKLILNTKHNKKNWQPFLIYDPD